MPAPLVWTESRDAILIELRAEGRSWDSISALFGISRWAAIQRGRLVGACKPELPALRRDSTDSGREPLPAGHPVSWGAITIGTLLAGLPYPAVAAPAAQPAVHRQDMHDQHGGLWERAA